MGAQKLEIVNKMNLLTYLGCHLFTYYVLNTSNIGPNVDPWSTPDDIVLYNIYI